MSTAKNVWCLDVNVAPFSDGHCRRHFLLLEEDQAWLPDVFSQILRSYVFGPLGLKDYGSTTLQILPFGNLGSGICSAEVSRRLWRVAAQCTTVSGENLRGNLAHVAAPAQLAMSDGRSPSLPPPL